MCVGAHRARQGWLPHLPPGREAGAEARNCGDEKGGPWTVSDSPFIRAAVAAGAGGGAATLAGDEVDYCKEDGDADASSEHRSNLRNDFDVENPRISELRRWLNAKCMLW